MMLMPPENVITAAYIIDIIKTNTSSASGMHRQQEECVGAAG